MDKNENTQRSWALLVGGPDGTRFITVTDDQGEVIVYGEGRYVRQRYDGRRGTVIYAFDSDCGTPIA